MPSHFSHVRLCALWTVAHQAPLSMGLSRQKYWSGLPFPSPGDLPDPGMEPASLMSPTSAGSLPVEPPEKPIVVLQCCVNFYCIAKWFGHTYRYIASLVAQMVKNLLAVQEILFSPWVKKIPWRREWQPTPISLPGEFHEQRSLAGYNPWGRKESDTT